MLMLTALPLFSLLLRLMPEECSTRGVSLTVRPQGLSVEPRKKTRVLREVSTENGVERREELSVEALDFSLADVFLLRF